MNFLYLLPFVVAVVVSAVVKLVLRNKPDDASNEKLKSRLLFVALALAVVSMVIVFLSFRGTDGHRNLVSLSGPSVVLIAVAASLRRRRRARSEC